MLTQQIFPVIEIVSLILHPAHLILQSLFFCFLFCTKSLIKLTFYLAK